ncbi:MAG TPA: carbohydrate-binding protein [Polyangiaceae bacterium]|nr:carbohydrate-binding protein [Polyangiaceae bacterium]
MKLRSIVSASVVGSALLATACSSSRTGTSTDLAKAESVGSVSQAITYAPQPVGHANTTKRVFMHYMPWFEAKNTQHGYSRKNAFGWHWTMNNCTAETNGLLNSVCAVEKPLIGPYSSSDPYVIEYHLLLIKYAGFDGVALDWGGVLPVGDLPDNKYNGDQMINRLSDFGLKFLVVSEDRNYQRDNQAGVADSWAGIHNDSDDIADLAADLNCLKAGGTCGNQYFGNSQYEKFNNVPVLLTFGPAFLQQGFYWDQGYAAAGLNSGSTYHAALWYQGSQLGNESDGTFAWIWQGAGAVGDASWTAQTHEQYYCDNEPVNSSRLKVASIFASHDTYYARGGAGSDAGNFQVPFNGGAQIDQSADKVLGSNANYVQFATFNDWGENTQAEPSVGQGYTALQHLQTKLGAGYGLNELQLIKRLFDERVKARKNNDTTRQANLDQASAYLAAKNISGAQTIIDGTAPPPPNGTQSAYGSGQSIPGTIQAENYDNGGEGVAFHDTSTANEGAAYRTGTGDSVDVEGTGDAGGGYDIGWTNSGEWQEYTFTNSTTRNYDFKARLANPGNAAKISISLDDVLISPIVNVPSTGGWQTYADVPLVSNKQVTSGTHVLRVTTEAGGFNFNNIGVAVSATGPVCGNGSCESGESCSSCSSDCGSCSTQAPYGGTPASIPGMLEMDRFDTGGEGVAYHDDNAKNGYAIRTETNVDLENTNNTGVNLGWNVAGEWVKFTVNVLTAGNYDMTIQTAGNGGTFKFSTTGATTYDSGALTAVNTGAWQTYSPVTKTGVYLNAGTTVIKLEMLANVAFNLKKMNFVASGTGNPPNGPPPVNQWPYGTTQQYPTPIAIGSNTRIEAENYDNGGEGIAFHDDSTGNSGDSNHRVGDNVDICFHSGQESKLCWGNSGEWTEYTVNVQTSAAYDITTRYANGCSNNGSFQLLIDDKSVGTQTATFTSGDWGSFRTTTLSAVNLQSGNHVFKYLNLSGCHDVDYFNFAVNTGSPPPPPPTGPTLTKILKNVANGQYMYVSNGVIKYTSNPDTFGAAAQWVFEDYAGYKRLRNLSNNCLANIEHLYSYIECTTGTPDGWMSNRWTFTMVGSNYVFNNAWQNTQANTGGNDGNVRCTSDGTNSDAQWIYTP